MQGAKRVRIKRERGDENSGGPSNTAWKKPGRKNKLMNEVDVCTEREANAAEWKMKRRRKSRSAFENNREAPVEKNKLMNEVGKATGGGRQRRAAKKNAAARRVQRAWKKKSARLKAADHTRPRSSRHLASQASRCGRAKLPAPTGWDAVDVFRNSGHRARSPKIEWVRYESAG